MIGFLRGTVVEVGMDAALIDVGGVGYEISCSANTLSEMQASQKEVFVWVYTHVREDVLQLFGFLSKAEKDFFLSLLKVNGIGAKMAITILSGGTLRQILQMIEEGDVKKLSTLPKVGKKTAEQMILTLKGKLVLSETAKVQSPAKSEIASALVNLGFKSQDVEKVIETMPAHIEVQEGVRLGLQALSSHS